MWRFFRPYAVGSQQFGGSQYRLIAISSSNKDENKAEETSPVDDADTFGTLSEDHNYYETPKLSQRFAFKSSQVKNKVADIKKNKLYNFDSKFRLKETEKSSSLNFNLSSNKNISNEIQNSSGLFANQQDANNDDLQNLSKAAVHIGLLSNKLKHFSKTKLLSNDASDTDTKTSSVEKEPPNYIKTPEDTFGELNNDHSEHEFYTGDKTDTKIEAYELSLDLEKETPEYYSKKMIKLSNEGKLKEAIAVLEEEMPSVRAAPNHHCFRVLMNCCAKAGYTQKVFDLYKKMKERGEIPKPMIYTIMFVACGNSPWPEEGLKSARYLRDMLQTKQMPLNEKNYHAMIRAFGRCGDVQAAFEIMDEMMDNGRNLSTETFNFLLQACISDKQSGFRHAVMMWRKMRRMKHFPPNLYSYNLLLRVVLHCQAGDKELLAELLQEPSLPPRGAAPLQLSSQPKQKQLKFFVDLKEGIAVLDSTEASTEAVPPPPETRTKAVGKYFKRSCPPATKPRVSTDVDTVSISTDVDTISVSTDSVTLPAILAATPSSGSVVGLVSLDAPEDRLALLGGSAGLLQQMVDDSVSPDIKTFTQLLMTLPGTVEAEQALLRSMHHGGVPPDVTFCNLLIKKRNYRKQEDEAKLALELLAEHHLVPNILTYGCMAIGCRTLPLAVELLSDMDKNGHRPNLEIMSTLTGAGIFTGRFFYALEMLRKMHEYQLEPDEKFLLMLERGRTKAAANIRRVTADDKQLSASQQQYVDGNRVFLLEYRNWLQRSTVKRKEHPWAHYAPDQYKNSATVDQYKNSATVDQYKNSATRVDRYKNSARVDQYKNSARVDQYKNSARVDQYKNSARVDQYKNSARVAQYKDSSSASQTV